MGQCPFRTIHTYRTAYTNLVFTVFYVEILRYHLSLALNHMNGAQATFTTKDIIFIGKSSVSVYR